MIDDESVPQPSGADEIPILTEKPVMHSTELFLHCSAIINFGAARCIKISVKVIRSDISGENLGQGQFFMNMAKAALGAGVTTLPAALQQSGYFCGVLSIR